MARGLFQRKLVHQSVNLFQSSRSSIWHTKKNRNGAVLVCADHITIKVLQNQERGLKAGTPFDYSRHGSGLPWREEITKSVPVSREIAMFQKTHQISQFTVFT